MKLNEIAKTYLGTRQGDKKHKEIIDGYNRIVPLPRGYRMKYTDSWCCAFVSYIETKVDLINPVYECSCLQFWNTAKKNKQTITAKNVQIGDIILYDWGNNGTLDHIGIIDSISDTSYYVIEGNYSKQVKIRQIAKSSKEIEGFVHIAQKENVSETVNRNDLIEQMAQDVIKGKYGVGAERKKLLGEYYSEVQKRVNALLKK